MIDDEFGPVGKKLYDNGKIQIHLAPGSLDQHDLIIEDNRVFLGNGVLRRWARSSPSAVASDYYALRRVPYGVENPNVDVSEFRWALSTAVNRKLEN